MIAETPLALRWLHPDMSAPEMPVEIAQLAKAARVADDRGLGAVLIDQTGKGVAKHGLAGRIAY